MDWSLSGDIHSKLNTSFDGSLVISVQLLALDILKSLHRWDFRTLVGVELGMKHAQFSPIESIANYSGLNSNEVEYRLDRLSKMGLVRQLTKHYTGYYLTFHGYDALALDALWKGGHVYSIGEKLAVGKEADLYFSSNKSGEEFVLKFHRAGRTSFQDLTRKRSYLVNKGHTSFIYKSRLNAQAEVKNLQILQDSQLPIPKLYAHNRHVLLLSLIDGVELRTVHHLNDPLKTLEEIIDVVYNLWHDFQVIHADLSGYNILISQDGKDTLTLIDFPQMIEITHPNAIEILTRDLVNLITFFTKRFLIGIDVTEVLAYITE